MIDVCSAPGTNLQPGCYGTLHITISELLLELIEPAILVVTAAAVVYVLSKTNQQHVTQMSLIRSLENGRAKGQEFRTEVREMVKGLGQAIDTQFVKWGLTDAEREIGLLLLKGLNHKKIAVMRQSSERTVRRQASSIYSKASLSGRAALSSYFSWRIFCRHRSSRVCAHLRRIHQCSRGREDPSVIKRILEHAGAVRCAPATTPGALAWPDAASATCRCDAQGTPVRSLQRMSVRRAPVNQPHLPSSARSTPFVAGKRKHATKTDVRGPKSRHPSLWKTMNMQKNRHAD